mgnify:CR=1 FL=1
MSHKSLPPARRLAMVLVTGAMCGILGSAEATSMVDKTNSPLTAVPAATWEKLAAKKMYFGHQSVGDNILVGLRELLAAHPSIKLAIQERAELTTPTRPGLIHSYVGTNELPHSKNEAFAKAITDKLRNNVDVAFFKYCYVDINPSTDPAVLFQTYRNTMTELKRQNPNVTFIHITSPLTTVQTGWKATVKKLMGRLPAGYADNAKRAEFNELMRKEYGGKEPLFDLATLEATRSDGTASSYEHGGRRYLSLAPEYSDDGGHLNAVGRKHVAENLLLFLAKQVTEQRI